MAQGIGKGTAMTVTQLRIDFISDVVCPWCVIGLRGLEQALAASGDALTATIHPHPFELNPDMPPEGENVREHIARKYGRAPDDNSAVRDQIRTRAADLGFAMNSGADSRIVNTFDAHRLLHWAEQSGTPLALKHALFTAYFTDQRDVSAHDVLIDCATAAGLNGDEARAILTSDRYTAEVRAEETYWRREGITAVPTMIVEGKYAIQGGHPPDVIEKALRRIAASA
jgi:predicted DsbA family dithiol-disulfide isomerase